MTNIDDARDFMITRGDEEAAWTDEILRNGMGEIEVDE